MHAYGIDVVGVPSFVTARSPVLHRATCERYDALPPLAHAKERSGDGWRVEHDDDRLRLELDRGATFAADLKADAATIGIALEEWSFDKASVFVLLGFVPLLLPRFELAPLHGAAFSRDGSHADLVLGHTWSGKTSTLATFLARGAEFVADDACAIDDGGRVWPGPAIWATRNEQPSDLPDYNGKAVLVAERPAQSTLDVGSTLILEPTDGVDFTLEELRGTEALVAVLGQSRSPWLFTSPDDQARRLRAAQTVASRPVARIRYDQARFTPDTLCDALESWLDTRQ